MSQRPDTGAGQSPAAASASPSSPGPAPRLVVLDGATLNPGDNPWDGLEELGELTVYPRSTPDEVIPRAQLADILVINKIPLKADRLAQLPNLRLIAVTATGYDCVDAAAARSRNIDVVNVPVYGTASVAQLTIAHLLHIFQRIDLHDAAVRAGEWEQAGNFSFWKFPLRELAGKTIGIVGLGRIGHQVAVIAQALGMQVLAHSRTQRDVPELPGLRWRPLNELFAESDVVSLHCPATPDTVGMINAESLSRFRPQAVLINVSRGSLIVEADLVAALQQGKLAGACLDVAREEPLPASSALLSAPRCWITPHLAWATLEARQRLMQQTVANIRAYLAGTPIHVVNPSLLSVSCSRD